MEIANTDSQTLSIIGNNLSIAGGNTVALPAGTSIWTEVTANSNYEIAQFPTDAEIKFGNSDLSNMDFNSGD